MTFTDFRIYISGCHRAEADINIIMRKLLHAKSVPNSSEFSSDTEKYENFWQGKIIQIESEQPPKVQRYVKLNTVDKC